MRIAPSLVRAVGLVTLSLALPLSACDESTGIGDGTGSIHLAVVGLPPGAEDAGTIHLVSSSIDTTLELGAVTSVQREVPAGSYEVSYTPPPAYEVAGGIHTRTVDIAPGAVESIVFSVTPLTTPTGTLSIVVAGTSGVSTAGSVRVSRTTPPMESVLTIPQSGRLDVPLAAAVYQVEYAAPAGFDLDAGQTNPRSVTISEGETETVTYAVHGSSSSQNVLFFSDWRTARGNSLQAVTDGGKWNSVSAEHEQTMEIVATTGLDFPTANAYRVIGTASRSGWSELRHTSLPLPSVGQSRFYRWYIRITMPDGLTDDQTHPIQDNYLENWGFIVYNGGGGAGVPNGMWRPEFWSLNSGWPYERWRAPNLQKNRTYRVELQVHRTGSSTYRMHVRIFDSAGNPVVQDADVRSNDGSVTLATNPTLQLGNLNALNGITAGNNGIGDGAPFPFTISYQAAFAVCADTWCGPYTGEY